VIWLQYTGLSGFGNNSRNINVSKYAIKKQQNPYFANVYILKSPCNINMCFSLK